MKDKYFIDAQKMKIYVENFYTKYIKGKKFRKFKMWNTNGNIRAMENYPQKASQRASGRSYGAKMVDMFLGDENNSWSLEKYSKAKNYEDLIKAQQEYDKAHKE